MFSDVNNKEIFRFFSEISKIPRGSGNEAKIADYLENFAAARGLECVRDSVNNVLIRKSASVPELKNNKPIMLQGHTDMVCEAEPGIDHDFTRDPIKFIREGDVLRANGTTLGADNGVAVAVMLAVLDSSDVAHPELECLFTVGEEVGMDGMTALDTSLLRSRRMINLDSAGEGVATVSCAGGVRSDFSFVPDTQVCPDNVKCCKIKVSGFYGGHSGEDIGLGRSNAIEALVRTLRFISETASVYVVGISGGEKDNAIPRDAYAEIALSADADLTMAIDKARALIAGELVADDAAFSLDLSEISAPSQVMTLHSSSKLLSLLSVFRSGPVMYSKSIRDMVETSYNLGIVRADAGGARFTISSRSSVEVSLDDMENKMRSIARLADVDIDVHGRYPGWKYAERSELRDTYLDVYKTLYGKDATAIGIHAGLECGLLIKRVPDMDIISIGPDIKDLHSPSETLGIASFDRFYDIIKEILKRG